MSLWMCFPCISIPDESVEEYTTDYNSMYKRINYAFAKSPRIKHEDINLSIPRAQCDRETLASKAVEMLIKERVSNINWKPDILIDCLSSNAITVPAPTYKLAVTCNLTDAMPISLSGQAGVEVASAVLLMESIIKNLPNGILVSAVQQVVYPDNRFFENRFPLADGSAATLLTNQPMSSGKNLQILGGSIAQASNNSLSACQATIIDTLRKAGLDMELISWAVAQRANNEFLIETQKSLPKIKWLTRDLYPELDFGAADLLISLENMKSSTYLLPSSIGLLCFSGLFGTVGSLLVRVESS